MTELFSVAYRAAVLVLVLVLALVLVLVAVPVLVLVLAVEVQVGMRPQAVPSSGADGHDAY